MSFSILCVFFYSYRVQTECIWKKSHYISYPFLGFMEGSRPPLPLINTEQPLVYVLYCMRKQPYRKCYGCKSDVSPMVGRYAILHAFFATVSVGHHNTLEYEQIREHWLQASCCFNEISSIPTQKLGLLYSAIILAKSCCSYSMGRGYPIILNI